VPARRKTMKKPKLGKKDIFAPLTREIKVPRVKSKQINKFTSKHNKPLTLTQEEQNKKRQTYHMRVDLIPKIKEYAYFEKVDISDVVNDAIDKFLKGYKPKSKQVNKFT
jgi:phage FluMu protein Com